MQKMPAYVIVSLVFFILTGVGFAYSCFFYPFDHPMECLLRAYTGRNCPTCGFSRAFSYYTHFKLSEGMAFNPLSLRVFLFFAIQLFWRGGIVAWYFITKRSVSVTFMRVEIIISISLFLLAFLPVLTSFKNYGSYH